MSASTKETTKVKITITDTSPKKSPIIPSKNKKIANAMMVVKMADNIAGSTSITPSTAACSGVFPFS